MTPDQIRTSIEKFGMDKLIRVQLNNSKVIMLSPENRDKIEFDYGTELITLKERIHGVTTVSTIPMAIVEGLTFKDGEQPSYVNSTERPGVAVDENGHLVQGQW